MLLTISIPTYNRAKYLHRSLSAIFSQKADFKNNLNIQIFDNCSSDNTKDIVKSFQEAGNEINYVINAQNIGADKNIRQSYLSAKSKYVLVLGDDDVLMPGSIKYILELLKNGDYGLVFLNFYQFLDNPEMERPKQFSEKTYIYKGEKILKYILSNIAFISSNIVNTKYLSNEDFDLSDGTGLNQIPGIIEASKSKENVFINKFYLAQQKENSGGYSYFNVFGENFATVTNNHLDDKSKAKNQIFNHLLLHVFPYHVYNLVKNDKVGANITYEMLHKYFNKRPFFWLLIFPILRFPKPLSYISYTWARVCNKVFYIFDRIHTGKVLKF